MLLRGPRRRSHQSRTSGNDFWNRYVFSRWRNGVNEGDDWISDGRVFHRVDAATGNDRRPMDSSRYAGMSSWCDVDDQQFTTTLNWQTCTTSLSGREDSALSSDERMSGRNSPSSSWMSASASRLSRLSCEANRTEWRRTMLLLPSCRYVSTDTSVVLTPVTAA